MSIQCSACCLFMRLAMWVAERRALNCNRNWKLHQVQIYFHILNVIELHCSLVHPVCWFSCSASERGSLFRSLFSLRFQTITKLFHSLTLYFSTYVEITTLNRNCNEYKISIISAHPKNTIPIEHCFCIDSLQLIAISYMLPMHCLISFNHSSNIRPTSYPT